MGLHFPFRIFFLIFGLIKIFNCELYSAKVELESLLETQIVVTHYLENYISDEEVRLRNIREKIIQFKRESESSRENYTTKSSNQKNVENPFESFRLIKSLSINLEEIVKIFNKREDQTNFNVLNSTIKLLNSSESQINFPERRDLVGAAVAIGRLQNIYNLNISRMAEGYINDHCCSEKLDFDDFYKISNELYNTEYYNRSHIWAELTYEEYKNEKMNDKKIELDILGTIYSSSFEMGFDEKAIEYAKKYLEIDPDNEMTIKNLDYFLNTSSHGIKRKPEHIKHDQLCRGENLQNIMNPKLKCKYTHNNLPYLLIGPYKEEMMNFDPKISIFHEILSDNEIKEIIKESIPKLERANIFKANDEADTEVRVSKGGWLDTNELDATEKLSRRIEEFTGLCDKDSEEFNVVNYGLLGQYELHTDYMDYGEPSVFDDIGLRNRIATVLIYLSDVELGGFTVFPRLDVFLQPRKGSAAFWYNLHDDGYTDHRTLHAGCPVVFGTKWIINRWIHEAGQEFLRPCKLKPSSREKDTFFDKS